MKIEVEKAEYDQLVKASGEVEAVSIKLTDADEQIEKLSADHKEATDKIVKLEADIKKFDDEKVELNKLSAETKIDSFIEVGKILPKQKDYHVGQYLNALAAGTLDAYIEDMDGRKAVVELGAGVKDGKKGEGDLNKFAASMDDDEFAQAVIAVQNTEKLSAADAALAVTERMED